ncbi:putative aminopeptidase YsdC [Alicyclobacillus contaminans]|nr:putative aminopeptidase YsdC [Alicyclobacillus contaminans]
MTTSRELIQRLADAHGISGFERNVRKLYESYLAPVSEELIRDRFGGVVGKKTGDASGPKVLIAGHLDEIGMVVTHITDDGFLYFQTVGGWWSQVMLAQRVVVHTRKGELMGVIGSKPPHLLTAEERNKVVKIQDMYIDIGVKDKEEAESFGVRPGDPISPWGPFTPLANGKYFMAKALDNRLGSAAAVEVLRALQGQSHPNVLFAGATAQEEVGLRGAQTLVHTVDPDVAIALDVGIAGDTPGMKKTEALSRCGEGPILLIYDGSMIPNTRFRDFVLDTAADAGLPVQVEYVSGGGTDAGKFHTHASGVPSVSIGFPTRYIHSHSAVYHQDDFDNAVRLVAELVRRLDASTVEDIQQY